MEPIELRIPSEHHERSIKAFINHMRPIRTAIIGGNGVEKLPFDTWIENTRDQRKGVALPKGLTANTTLLAFHGRTMIGIVNIRHELNKMLKRHYGQLGMTIHPDYRGKGLGNETLKAVKTYVKSTLNLDELFIVVPSDKPAMRAIVEKNDGKMVDVKKGTFKKLYRYTLHL